MKKYALLMLALAMFCSVAAAQDWLPEPMVIDAADEVTYAFDGSAIEIPFSLSGKAGKVWLVIETNLADEDKPVAVKNGFMGWHFVNGIDTTVYVSTPRVFSISTDNVFPWDGHGTEQGDGEYYDEVSDSGPVVGGEGVSYKYYLWGYDNQSSRELVCDFISIGSYWEAQYQRFYVTDDTGAEYDTPMMMGTVFWHHTGDSQRYGNADIFKWKIGTDPFDEDALEVSTVTGYNGDDQFEGYTVGYGAGVFDPTDHDVFFFAENRYWQKNQSVTRYEYIANGEAIRDLDWGGYENDLIWEHPGNKTNDSIRSVLTNLGDDYLVMLDGGQNPLDKQYDRLHVLSKDDPFDEIFDVQLDEFYMPGQPLDPATSYTRTISEINRIEHGKEDGTYFITGDWSCLQELIDVNRLMEDDTATPYAEDGSGYVVWANSNGDFFLDMSPYLDTEHPEQHWACIVSDPRNQNNPREESTPADMNGFILTYTEFTGLASFGVYCPDGSGMGTATFGDDSYVAGGDNEQKKGGGELMDYGGQFDGLYMMGAVTELLYTARGAGDLYHKTEWIAYDSDMGYIKDVNVAVAEEAPEAFTVAQNSPNPFNPTTTINFTLAVDGQVSVDVYNVAGQKVDTLVNDFMTAGSHSVVWDAADFAAGMYFYSVTAGDITKTNKMTLLK